MNDPKAEYGPLAVLCVASTLGTIHAVVDGSCSALLVQVDLFAAVSPKALWSLYLTYNVLAFGMQFTIGVGADRFRVYLGVAIGGLLLVASGVTAAFVPLSSWVVISPWGATVLAGLGNAAFHVGAGALVLRLSPNRAAAAGVFVAPGALGLAVGKWCGQAVAYWPWISLGMLIVSATALWMSGNSAARCSSQRPETPARRRPVLALALTALMLSIAIRSAIGFGVAGVYANTPSMLWYLVLAAVAGKALGGFVSDWLGWIKTSLLALLVSAPLLSYLVTDGTAATVGMVLFQMTMPVTLLAMYHAFPEEPGLAFGLPTLALLVGAIPSIVYAADWLSNPSLLAGLILASVICLSIGLPPILRTNARVP